MIDVGRERLGGEFLLPLGVTDTLQKQAGEGAE
jgi:hypothetical protein